MRDELTAQIIQEFPELFRESFYFECGDGWFELIQNLCKELMPLLPAGNAEHEDSWGSDFGKIRADQVKEKFGGLRFYMSWTTDEMSKLISKYESIAASTCETCGQIGEFEKIKGQVLCVLHK